MGNRNSRVNRLNIHCLDDKCLFKILEYLSREDHINFGHTCRRFRRAMQNWSASHYAEYQIDGYDLSSQFVLFSIISKSIRKLVIDVNDMHTFFSLFSEKYVRSFYIRLTGIFEEMYALEELEYLQLCDLPDTWNMELFEQSLLAFKDLPRLKSLCLDVNGCSIRVLSQFKQLEKLYLRTHLRTYDLVACCTANPQLRCLHLGYFRQARGSFINGQPMDIASKCLNLEELHFMAEEDFAYDGLNYVAFTELPKLKRLSISAHDVVLPAEIFAPLKRNHQFESLKIYGNVIGVNVTAEISDMRSLKELRCQIENAQSVVHIAQLELLEVLAIDLSINTHIAKLIDFVCLVKQCPNLRSLCITGTLLKTAFVFEVLNVLIKLNRTKQRCPLRLQIDSDRELRPLEQALIEPTLLAVTVHKKKPNLLPFVTRSSENFVYETYISLRDS